MAVLLLPRAVPTARHSHFFPRAGTALPLPGWLRPDRLRRLVSGPITHTFEVSSGQTIDASTQKPRVNYTLLEKNEGEQRSTFLFEGKIQSDDGTSFTRKWSIATRKESNGWRVSNFTESE